MFIVSTNFDTMALIGFIAGLVFFFKGFKVYREYRVLADTPEQPIRSIAMGLVQVHGKAKGEELVESPVTRTPCLFYRVDIERWQSNSKGGGSWSHYKTDASGVKFYLEDATGKVLVDARGAEYDLMQTGRREIGWGSGVRWGRALGDLFSDREASASTSGSSASDGELLAYVEGAAGSGPASFLGSVGQLALSGNLSLARGATGRHRLTECCILPEHWYDVTGSCVENPGPKDEHDRNLIQKGQNEPTFLISWRSERGVESRLRNRAALHIFGGAGLSILCLGYLLKKLGWL